MQTVTLHLKGGAQVRFFAEEAGVDNSTNPPTPWWKLPVDADYSVPFVQPSEIALITIQKVADTDATAGAPSVA